MPTSSARYAVFWSHRRLYRATAPVSCWLASDVSSALPPLKSIRDSALCRSIRLKPPSFLCAADQLINRFSEFFFEPAQETHAVFYLSTAAGSCVFGQQR